MIYNYKCIRCSKWLAAFSMIKLKWSKGEMKGVKYVLFLEVLKMEIPESHIHFAIKIFHPWSSFLSQEVWACWHELLSYLEKANKWLNEVELKLKTTENIPGGAEEISEVLSVSSELI